MRKGFLMYMYYQVCDASQLRSNFLPHYFKIKYNSTDVKWKGNIYICALNMSKILIVVY